jgi:DNA-binding PucR family transcriptional regulator
MSVLGNIMDEEEVSKIPLLETLNEYQKNNFNVAKTAQNLYIHRNTLLQRLEKIENALGKQLKDYNVRREIMNAFYLKKYVDF